MSDKRLYGAVTYDRRGNRSVVEASHCLTALRRRHPDAHLFAVEAHIISHATEYRIVGKEIHRIGIMVWDRETRPDLAAKFKADVVVNGHHYHYRRPRRYRRKKEAA